jgi:hypothetical protein
LIINSGNHPEMGSDSLLVILRAAFFADRRIYGFVGSARNVDPDDSAGNCMGPSLGVLGFAENSAAPG